MRDVKLQPTFISPVMPLVATLTVFRRSDELRIWKCSRFASMSLFSSALPRQLSLKSLTHVDGDTDEFAKSPRNDRAIAPSSFGESCTRIPGLVPLTTFCWVPPVP